MKCFGVFLLLVCIATSANGLIAASAIGELAKHQGECIAETGTSISDVEYTKKYGKFCDDGHMDKFAHCLLKKFHIIKRDETINQDSDSYQQNLVTDDPESVDKVKKCTLIRENNFLHTSRKIINCIIDSNVYVFDPRPTSF